MSEEVEAARGEVGGMGTGLRTAAWDTGPASGGGCCPSSAGGSSIASPCTTNTFYCNDEFTY